MNVLSAPFLYTLPTQIEAFACFSTFIEKHCPLYVQRDLRGVHRGLEVSEEFAVQEILDIAYTWTSSVAA
jgi:cell cycle arrest protein BUB2